MHDNNIIRVPPRRYKVLHKGMHGWVEYHPSTKTWSYSIKWQTTFTHMGEAAKEAEAVLELKTAIDVLSTGGLATVRSIE